jgi:N-methylhydantoinase B
VRQYRFLGREATLQLRADRAGHRPYGLFGGGEAAPSINVLNPGGSAEEVLPSKVTRRIQTGDVIRHEQPGGGGYGDSRTRDPKLIQRDLEDGKVTPAFAREWHGL